MPFGPNHTLERLARARGLQVATGKGVRLLGGGLSIDPTFHAQIVMERAQKCATNIRTMMRLKDPQLCLLLLRSCFGMPQLTYSFRVAPPSALQEVTRLLETTLLDALRWIMVDGTPLQFDAPFHLSLSSLPLRMGGLGITLPSDVGQFAHIACDISTLSLQCMLFPTLSMSDGRLRPLCDKFLSSVGITDRKKQRETRALILTSAHKTQFLMSDLLSRFKRLQLARHAYLHQWTPARNILPQHSLLWASYDVQPPPPRASPEDADSEAPYPLHSQWLLAIPNPRL
eukprot:gene27034-32667_t